jgi:ABC-2 type transport system permease protein
MRKLWIVTKNELMRYFVSPLAYVYLLSFLVLNASFAIYFGDFFNRGKADLLSMFMFLPWLYLLFIPGISMRLWAEEFRQKTVVQIVTQPVSICTLVLGKFFASWLFCATALAGTFPFWLTVNILGSPDNGVIAMGYVASLALAGCMLAISQTMSALTKNQVIALVLAVLANLFFFWSGVEYILSFFRLFLPDSAIDVIASFSFITHFDTLTKGLLELRDVLFFASVLVFFNFTTVLIVNFKTAGTSGWLKSSDRRYYLTAWIFLLIGFFGFNVIANNAARQLQYDATEEKIFTLTDGTKDVLRQLPEPVTAKLYFSPILEQRNPDLRNMFDNVRILLKKYKVASQGKFDYKVYYPKFLSEEEDVALADGVQAVPLIDLNQNALFGLTLEDTLQNKEVIPFFTRTEQGVLEQEITDKLYQLFHKKKKIGIIAGVPLFGSVQGDGTYVRDPWEIVKILQQSYQVEHITKADDFTDDFAAVVLFAPKDLSPEIIEKIKQYSKNGGSFLLVLDPVNETSRLYSYENNVIKSTSIGELADFWGIKFYEDYVVADLQNSITVDATINYNTNPVFTQDVIQFKVPHENMNPKHPVTKNLQELMLASASVIMPDMARYESGKIKFTPLLKAGDISSIITSKVVIDGLNPQDVLRYFEADDNQKILAAEVSGREADNPFQLIVVTDSDFLYDTFWADKQHFLEKEYTYNSFDNANFFLNAVDYLTLDQTMLKLRGKKAVDRRFNDVENLRRLNSFAFKQRENAIFDEMNAAKDAMQEVWNKKKFEERENFTADELAAISGVRQKLNALRQELSDLRNSAYNDIQKIANRVAIFNIVPVPALIALILLLQFLWHRRQRKMVSTSSRFDAKLAKLGLGCVALLIIGIISVYWQNRSEMDSYENRPVFANVAHELNNIDTITLRTNKQTLTFNHSADDNMWHLLEQQDLPVYQERIRRLLTTIANATYFARKSNKAQNLSMFNLAPIEDENSGVIQVILQAGEEVVTSFYLGDINVDLGRGATAAYIRFADQFQVWEIKADFVDMDLDWHNWTYAHLWDLRFGRLAASNSDEREDQRKMIILKELLNTPILKLTNKPDIKPILTLPLQIEEGNKVTISFYQNEKGEAFAVYEFDKNNQNHHLKLFASYLQGKAVAIDLNKLEKIREIINL